METSKLFAISLRWTAEDIKKIQRQVISEKWEAVKKAKATLQSSRKPDHLPSIPQLFKGKCVMVTGATGFLGRVLMEKLLRSCPDVHELLILLRPSEQGDGLKEYRDIFARLRRENPAVLFKIRKIAGDVKEANLGLNESQYQKVIRDVSFVFHCDANDKFDDECRNIMETNLLGVKNVLDICKECKNLKALVHVSTAYSFCNHSVIDEQLYPERADPENIIQSLEWINDDTFRDICMHYLGDRPSLNHLSKALAEILIVQSAQVPVIIVRPSMVTAAAREPHHGWIDRLSGPTELIKLCARGIIRTLLVKENVNADWVPVDIVANTLIAAARYMALRREFENSPLKLNMPSGVPIINCTCPENNMITWRNMMEICLQFLVTYPTIDIYRKPALTITASRLRYYFHLLKSNYIPAVLLDGIGCLILKRPRLVSNFNRHRRDLRDMEHYATHHYFFHSVNMQLLMRQLDLEDTERFPMDQSGLNWTLYMENYVQGIRRYFWKENDSTLHEARSKMRKIHYISMGLKLSSMIGLFLLNRALQRRIFLAVTVLYILHFCF